MWKLGASALSRCPIVGDDASAGGVSGFEEIE
jgi:hypothetical protein